MKVKKIAVLAFILLAVLLCTACGELVDTIASTDFGTKIEIQESGSIDDVKLRDNPLLYENSDPAEVVTMYLTVSEGNSAENTNHTWTEINTYSVYDYERMGIDRYQVNGLLQIGDDKKLLEGELGYGQISPNCTVQIRGQTSSSAPQKNYKISIKDNKGSWRGQTTIALNKHYSDGLRFRNKLAYDLIAGIDEMMGLRTTFVHLYVKDTTEGGNGVFVDYGLYTQVEQLNKTALKAHGLDKNGHLYKINLCEFYRYEESIKLKDDPTYDLEAFEEILEIKGSDDHEKLIEMLQKVNDYSIPIDTILEEHFDIENMSYWMGFQILMGNIDTQSRNFYIYSPLNSEKWYFIAWDNDGALKRAEYELNGRIDYSGWESGISNYWGNILFRRCLKSEKYIAALDSAIEDLMGYLTEDRIESMVSSYKTIAKPYVYRLPDRMYAPLTEKDYDTVASSSEIAINYQLYKDSFNKPMPFFISVPERNGDMLMLTWDNSYDFDAETITYTFELAKDYNFNEIIVKQENILLPEAEFDLLPEGQYFIRVTARNTSGYEQYAFDYYIIDSGKVYGTKCFYVDADGNIVEDIYVEG